MSLRWKNDLVLVEVAPGMDMRRDILDRLPLAGEAVLARELRR